MKSTFSLILLLLVLFLQAQEEKSVGGILIKTLPIQDAFYQNPNLIIEKPISDKYSTSIILALRYSDWIFKSSSFGGMKFPLKYDAKGFTVGGVFKYYYSKRPTPNGFYISGTIRYNDILMPEVHYSSDADPNNFRVVDLYRKSMELGAIWGYQVSVSRFIMDFYIGTGIQYRFSEEEFVSGNPKYVMTSYQEWIPRLYLGFSIGVKLF